MEKKDTINPADSTYYKSTVEALQYETEVRDNEMDLSQIQEILDKYFSRQKTLIAPKDETSIAMAVRYTSTNISQFPNFHGPYIASRTLSRAIGSIIEGQEIIDLNEHTRYIGFLANEVYKIGGNLEENHQLYALAVCNPGTQDAVNQMRLRRLASPDVQDVYNQSHYEIDTNMTRQHIERYITNPSNDLESLLQVAHRVSPTKKDFLKYALWAYEYVVDAPNNTRTKYQLIQNRLTTDSISNNTQAYIEFMNTIATELYPDTRAKRFGQGVMGIGRSVINRFTSTSEKPKRDEKEKRPKPESDDGYVRISPEGEFLHPDDEDYNEGVPLFQKREHGSNNR